MYSKLKIHGNCDIDYVWSKNNNVSDAEITSVTSAGISNINWDANTVMLANFNEDINARPSSVNDNVSKYLIQRRNAISRDIEDVAITHWNQIKDWACKSTVSYEYLITPIYIDENGNETFGSRIITDAIQADWDGVSIIDILPTGVKGCYYADENNLWSFDLNVEDITYTNNNDIKYITTYSRFPREQRGNLNYLTASIHCLIGSVTRQGYECDDINKIEAFRDFCTNGNLKLFKDFKGNVIPCSICMNTDTPNVRSLAHQTTITFDIVQLAANSNISVISEVY